MRVINCVQGSDEWRKARLGKATASRICDVMRMTKSGVSAMRVKYMTEKILERLTGQEVERKLTLSMQGGKENEPRGRIAYEQHAELWVIEVGFVLHPTLDDAGCSPDGLVGDDGLVEIKCPDTSTHFEHLIEGKIDRDYLLQMQMQMLCTGRAWCDFVSFDPRCPQHMQLAVTRVHADPQLQQEINDHLAFFLGETAGRLMRLKAIRPGPEDLH